tara:strand:- start:3679 stop:4446 length:768 start_codon:yes stop_codon:yes gene_type:complete
MKKLKDLISENINIPVKVGDTILTGRFKNKKIVVKTISKDKHGMPTINGRKAVTFRLMKELSEEMLDDTDLGLERGKVYVLQADSPKYKRGLIVRLLPDGGYDVKYWYNDPKNIYPVEVFIDGKSITKSGKVIKLGFHPELKNEDMSMGDLQKIDTYADSKMGVDVVLTGKHFFDRLNDPRNKKDISEAELIGFFKRLSKNKKKFIEFLNKYKQIVATDTRTNINIPFMKRANKVIAKTVMRKSDFKTSNLKFNI